MDQNDRLTSQPNSDPDLLEAQEASNALLLVADTLFKLPGLVDRLTEKEFSSANGVVAASAGAIVSLEVGVNLVNSALSELPDNLLDVDGIPSASLTDIDI